MCDAISAIAAGGLAVSVLAAGASAYGQYQQTTAANNAASYNQQVDNYAAQQATALGQVQQEQNAIATKQLQGRQDAAYAASGVDINTGSSLTVDEQTAGYGALDSLAIKQQAADQSWADQNNANLSAMRYVNPMQTTGTSLLQSGSQVGSSITRAYGADLFGGVQNPRLY